MKLVKEHINEEFKLDSDPIHDMHIGYKDNIRFDNTVDYFNRTFKKEQEKLIQELKQSMAEKLKTRLLKKLKGKFIEGTFEDKKYNRKKYKIKVDDIVLRTSWNYALSNIVIISDKKEYILIYWDSDEYTITSY